MRIAGGFHASIPGAPTYANLVDIPDLLSVGVLNYGGDGPGKITVVHLPTGRQRTATIPGWVGTWGGRLAARAIGGGRVLIYISDEGPARFMVMDAGAGDGLVFGQAAPLMRDSDWAGIPANLAMMSVPGVHRVSGSQYVAVWFGVDSGFIAGTAPWSVHFPTRPFQVQGLGVSVATTPWNLTRRLNFRRPFGGPSFDPSDGIEEVTWVDEPATTTAFVPSSMPGLAAHARASYQLRWNGATLTGVVPTAMWHGSLSSFVSDWDNRPSVRNGVVSVASYHPENS